MWSPEGAQTYSHLVSPQLKLLRESWLDSSSPASMSVLLKMTNFVLANTASKTNKAVSLAQRPTPKSAPTPKVVLSAKQQLNKAHKKLKHARMSSTARKNFKKAQKNYKQTVRTSRVRDGVRRDEQLHPD